MWNFAFSSCFRMLGNGRVQALDGDGADKHEKTYLNRTRTGSAAKGRFIEQWNDAPDARHQSVFHSAGELGTLIRSSPARLVLLRDGKEVQIEMRLPEN